LNIRLSDGQSETFAVEFRRAPTVLRSNSSVSRVVPIALQRLDAVSLGVRVPQKICVLKLDHIGDFVMALPALASLRGKFPNADISLICGPWATEIAKSTGLFDSVNDFAFFAEASGEVARNSDSAIRRLRIQHDFGRFIATTRRERFDLAIDLRHDPDTRQLLTAIPAQVTAGFGTTREFPFLHICLAMTHTEQPAGQVNSGAIGRDQSIAMSALTPIGGFRRSHTALIAEPDPEWAPVFFCSSDSARAGDDSRHLSFGIVSRPDERATEAVECVYGFEDWEPWGVWSKSRLAIARIKRPARNDQAVEFVLKSPTLQTESEREVSVFTALGRERSVSFTRSHQSTAVTLDAVDFDAGWRHGFVTRSLELNPGDWTVRVRVQRRGEIAPDLMFWGIWLGADGKAEQSFAWTATEVADGRPCDLLFPLAVSPGRARGTFLFVIEGAVAAGHLEVAGLKLERKSNWLARERTHQSTLNHALIDAVISHFVRPRDLRGMVKAQPPPAAQEIAAARATGNKAIVIAPGCNAEVRKWPVGHWAELCSLILRDIAKAVIFLVGGPDDHIECAHLEELLGSDRVRNVCGAFKLAQLPAVLQEADIFVGNNTGTTHVAAATGVRVLAIYSGTNQVSEWAPFGRNGTVLHADLPCSPCHIGRPSECPHDLECMTTISPSRVLSELQSSLVPDQ
jgi:ADP-heptose:LPS heptosyltransferase